MCYFPKRHFLMHLYYFCTFSLEKNMSRGERCRGHAETLGSCLTLVRVPSQGKRALRWGGSCTCQVSRGAARHGRQRSMAVTEGAELLPGGSAPQLPVCAPHVQLTKPNAARLAMAAPDTIVCPFNADHQISCTEFRMHMLSCKDKPRAKQSVVNPNVQFPRKKSTWRTLELKEEPREEPRQDGYFDTLDPEKLVQCPYDGNHQIRACRFPYHIVKCRKNHPDVVRQLAICPFNARHQVPRAEISHHISTCDDKSCIEQDIVDQSSGYRREEVPLSTWQSPPCDEDWDQDLQEQSGPAFIWGKVNFAVSSTGPKTLMEQKSNLGSTLRAPKSLPYVLPWKANAASKEYTG